MATDNMSAAEAAAFWLGRFHEWIRALPLMLMTMHLLMLCRLFRIFLGWMTLHRV